MSLLGFVALQFFCDMFEVSLPLQLLTNYRYLIHAKLETAYWFIYNDDIINYCDDNLLTVIIYIPA